MRRNRSEADGCGDAGKGAGWVGGRRLRADRGQRVGLITHELEQQVLGLRPPQAGRQLQRARQQPRLLGAAPRLWPFSGCRHNRSRILVRQGERYQLEVARTQVWKDGDLDPCDILGWNTKKSGADAKRPWENGEPADHNALSTRLIRLGGRKKLVQNADWFQLVVGVDGDGFEAPAIALPASETEPYRLSYEPGADGRLSLAANDLYSRIGVIDKYDNNAGWIWVKVTRTA